MIALAVLDVTNYIRIPLPYYLFTDALLMYRISLSFPFAVTLSSQNILINYVVCFTSFVILTTYVILY